MRVLTASLVALAWRRAHLLILASPPSLLLCCSVWARLYRSLEMYLHPMGDEDNGILSFFSTHFAAAVRKRYLHNHRMREAEVAARLAGYFMHKADPSHDHRFGGEQLRYVEDVVYYQLR